MSTQAIAAEVPRGRRSARTTALGAWSVVLLLTTALVLVRLPVFIEVASQAVGDEAEALQDPALAEAAITIGAVGGIALHLVMLTVAAAVAALLERWLGPKAIGRGALRVGVAGAVFTVIVLGQQIAALVLAVAAAPRGWQLYAAALAVALLTPLAFPEARRSLQCYAKAAAASTATGALLCLG